MESIVMWVSIGILALFLVVGLVCGLIRGLKRSSLHIIFMLASFIIAFLVTKPITEAILSIKIPVDGEALSISEYIASMLQESFDLTKFETASGFIDKLPSAIVSPILFILVSLVLYGICSIIYLIVARISFGKKKEDFKKNKPYRWFGGLIGMAEAFLFMFLLFAPLTSLTKTYQEILQPASTEVSALSSENNLKTIGETLNETIPAEVNEIIISYNNSVLGKVCGAGGIDNAIFDHLSTFELNNEEINFREEILTLTDVYDDFVVTYNDINAKNYSNIDLTNLKTNIEKFLDNGIFKTVISDTVKDYVLKFDELNMENTPQLLKDIVSDLSDKFKEEDFNIHQYLKEDILKLVDTLDVVFKNGIIEKYEALEKKDFQGILEIVDSKSEAVETVVENVLNLNIVSDAFNALGNFASEKISESFENDKGLEFGLNTQIDKSTLVNEVMSAVEEFIDINDYVDISKILDSEDIMTEISNIKDIEGALVQIGTAFDKVRELDLLILPVEQDVRDEKVYVFDNILSTMNIDLLGDKVYKNMTDVKQTSLDTYTALFDYLKTPIKTVKDLNILNKNATFDNILDNILIGLKQDENLLSGILLPFYQLDEASFNTTTADGTFKAMVFDKVVDMLESNTNELIDFAEVKTLNNIIVWNEEFTNIGKTLNNLNTGEIGTDKKTYIKYMLSDGADLIEVLKDMTKTEGKISSTLKPIFDARSFANIENQIFDEIDSSITDITGIVKATDKTNLDNTQANVLQTIEDLLTKILNLPEEEIPLETYGEILDILKTNSYNDTTDDDTNNGSKDGVFNNIFCNILYFMTRDNAVLNGADITNIKANENSEDIIRYINEKYSNLGEDKYYLIDYTTMMTEVDEMVTFASTIYDKLPESVDFETEQGVKDFVAAIETSVNTLSKEKQVEVIENPSTLVTDEKYNFISEEDITAHKDEIVSAIDETFTNKDVAEALKKLLQLNTAA